MVEQEQSDTPSPFFTDGSCVIYNGDCSEVLLSFPDNSIDAVVTDPPYGLSFMGKRWDYDVPSIDVWVQCLRVLKPGGHLLAFAGTRTVLQRCNQKDSSTGYVRRVSQMCDDLPRPDWPIERRIALAALLEIRDTEPDEFACGDESDGVTAETARMRILNNDWQKYDDHEEFLKELDRQCQ